MTPATSQRRSPPLHRPQLEGDIKPRVKRALEAMGCVVIPQPAGHPQKMWGVQCAPKGWPDLEVRIPPGFVGLLELKKPGGKRSPDQIRMHAWLRRNGYEVETADGIEAAVEVVKMWRMKMEERRGP